MRMVIIYSLLENTFEVRLKYLGLKLIKIQNAVIKLLKFWLFFTHLKEWAIP